MMRLFYLMVVLLAGAVIQVQAAPTAFGDADSDGKVTQEEFLTAKKAVAEKSGKKYSEERSKKQFDQKDTNKDGVLSADELAPAPKKTDK